MWYPLLNKVKWHFFLSISIYGNATTPVHKTELKIQTAKVIVNFLTISTTFFAERILRVRKNLNLAGLPAQKFQKMPKNNTKPLKKVKSSYED